LDNAGDFLDWWFEGDFLQGKTEKVFKRYYSNYYKNFSGYLKRAWTDRHRELDEALREGTDRNHLRVLDLGCGTGSISLYVAAKYQDGCEVVGLDINEDRIQCAEERKKVLEKKSGRKIQCRYMNTNLLNLDDEIKFDIIFLEETFHHLEPRFKVVRKISDLLRDGGVLIISEVNAYNVFMQLQLLKRRGFKTIRRMTLDDGQVIDYGVERIVTARRLIRLFKFHGLRVKSLRYFRIASAKLGNILEKMGFDLLSDERVICNIPFFNRSFAVHYNIVFKKD